MFGFGSSSEKPAGIEPGVAPTREQRQKCWTDRDAYFACLDKNGIVQPGTKGEMADTQGVCEQFRAAYEGSCGKSWIDYFNKRRVLEARSAATLEAAAKQREEAARR